MTVDVKSLPKYSSEEENLNSISHCIGFVFASCVTIFFFIYQLENHLNFVHMLPFYVYSFFMMMMFFVSSYYHSSPINSKTRAYTRTLDHCDIYAFVFATYLPICVFGITSQKISYLVMFIELILSAIGIIINALPRESKIGNFISYIIYIISGWAIVIFYPFNIGISSNTFFYILLGGIIYTIGAILYSIGHYKKWYHSIFHIFVLLAAVVQFIGIYSLL